LISTISCDDTNVASNTYIYTVTAVYDSWTATSAASGSVTVPASELSSFTLTPSTSTPTAGAAFTLSITAVDQYGNTDRDYTGPQNLTFSGPVDSPSNTAPIYPASFLYGSGSVVTFTSGVATGTNAASVILFDAQSIALTVSASSTNAASSTLLSQTTTPAAAQAAITGTSDSLTVGASSASSFRLADPGRQTAGSPFDETITALDQYGNTATDYGGAKQLTFSHPSNSPNGATPVYPSSVTFTSGVATASGITLVDAETTTLGVTDGTISGTSDAFAVS
jgi:hypothetical protein